jgi:hypothetical protein
MHMAGVVAATSLVAFAAYEKGQWYNLERNVEGW